VELQRALAELVSRGVTTVVMEASSHALDQRRLETLGFGAAVYTNFTHDHLDYHPDVDAYRDAKLLLSELLVEGGVEVVNRDEAAWRALRGRGELRRVWWGTGEDVDVRARDVSLEFTGARFTLEFGDEALPAALPLLGDFNVSNALAAAATAWAVGEDAGAIVERLRSAPQVPGRMERLVHGEFVVLRDYAHTPDALERAIEALRPVTEGRLIVLFGAGGDRDRAKRPIMGAVAARGADIAVVTSDNPRTEDPDAIIDEIEIGMGEFEHVRIHDRREAIRHAVGMCRAGDVLLLAGKGHETYQVVGTERHPFDEKTIVAEVVAERGDA
jgi:UDP-N-acetylmuramoyl-L-alanyl-D-glutamate--2,6-diaminopimelate ligase